MNCDKDECDFDLMFGTVHIVATLEMLIYPGGGGGGGGAQLPPFHFLNLEF